MLRCSVHRKRRAWATASPAGAIARPSAPYRKLKNTVANFAASTAGTSVSAPMYPRQPRLKNSSLSWLASKGTAALVLQAFTKTMGASVRCPLPRSKRLSSLPAPPAGPNLRAGDVLAPPRL